MLLGVFACVLRILLSEWTSPGADGAKVSSCEFDRLSAELSSLVILETHNGNSKVLLRLCCLAQVKSGKIRLYVVKLTSLTNNGRWGWFSHAARIVSWLPRKDKKHFSDLCLALFVKNPSQRQHGIMFEHQEPRASLVCFSWCAQSCPTLCHPRDCSPSGLSVHRIF